MTGPSAPANLSEAPIAVPCPRCGAATNGRFCGECGTPVGNPECGRCAARLSAGARYCHRCGTPAGARGVAAQGAQSVVPWVVAGVSLLALVVVLVLDRRRTPQAGAAAGGGANAATAEATPSAGRPPDLSQMSPRDAADRLFDRVMRLQEEGKRDSVVFFAPMDVFFLII